MAPRLLHGEQVGDLAMSLGLLAEDPPSIAFAPCCRAPRIASRSAISPDGVSQHVSDARGGR
jgi:hypothetical protein